MQRGVLPGGLERGEPANGAQHALRHVTLLPKALADLQVGVVASAFDAKIQRPCLVLELDPAVALGKQSQSAGRP